MTSLNRDFFHVLILLALASRKFQSHHDVTDLFELSAIMRHPVFRDLSDMILFLSYYFRVILLPVLLQCYKQGYSRRRPACRSRSRCQALPSPPSLPCTGVPFRLIATVSYLDFLLEEMSNCASARNGTKNSRMTVDTRSYCAMGVRACLWSIHPLIRPSDGVPTLISTISSIEVRSETGSSSTY